MCDCGNSFGGVTGDMFATPFNTIGMGDVIPAGVNTLGSGDKLAGVKNHKIKSKKSDNKTNDFLSTPPLIVYTK